MNETNRLATKAQAGAVREYLATLGLDISHTQALEVIARGDGMRSRHLLAAGKPSQSTMAAVVSSSPATLYRTRVGYSYCDGANCKRRSSLVFRGRLSAEQLRIISKRLDDGLYFVPAQVGFESLHLAFTDEGGDDHYWHKLELGDEATWELDQDGFVLRAGDIEQVGNELPGVDTTDAGAENLFWRFARILRWAPELQQAAVTSNAWRTVVEANPDPEEVEDLVTQWKQLQLAQFAPALLERLARHLLEHGFTSRSKMHLEMSRAIGPNAYQFCIVQPGVLPNGEACIELNFDVSTHAGEYLTHAPLLCVTEETLDIALAHLDEALMQQLREVRVMPEVYDAA